MTWWQRLRYQRRLERELDAELRDHLERLAAAYAARGVPQSEARRRAVLEFGGLEQVKESCRDVRGLGVLHDATHDARFALRRLRGHPGFTAVAVLALGLGIGANVAIFSLINALLFKAPAVEQPERLVFVGHCGADETSIDRLRRVPHVFTGVAGWMPTQFSVSAGGDAEWMDGLWVTDGYFETLGVAPAAGRTIPAGGAPRSVVISDRLWRSRFGASGGAVDQSIWINHVRFTIGGVAPREFTGLDVGRAFDVVAPLDAAPPVSAEQDGCGPLTVVARLAPGRTIESAAAALDGIVDRRVTLQPAGRGRSDLRTRYERPLLTIMSVAALVLLIACATLANLLLAQSAARRRELGVRLALGASRFRILRQIAIEGLVLGSLGAALGLAVAWWASRAIVAQLSAESVLATGRTIFGAARLFLDVSVDARVLTFTLAVSVLTVVLFVALPAFRASRLAPAHLARSASPVKPSRRRASASASLVVAQVALSFALLVTAGLFVRSLFSLFDVPLGFEPGQMVVVDMTAPPSAPGAGRIPVYTRVLESVRSVPGVTEATLSVSAPMTGWDLLVEVETGRGTALPGAKDSLANVISPGWFRAVGTTIVAGRAFTDADSRRTPPVVIVNEAFARQFLRGAPPLGGTVTIRGMGPERTPRAIVGVAADAMWSLRDPVPPILYVPLAQADEESLEIRAEEHGLTLGVRAAGRPEALRTSLAEAIRAVDARLILTFRSPAEHIMASLTQERVIAIVSAFFGALALVLSAVSLFGITAGAASRRRAEIGIRLALGGTPAGVVRAVAGPIWGMVAAGVACGAAASLVMAPLVSLLLYGVAPRDVLTFCGAAVTLCGVAAVSGWIPAYRAARAAPVAALRVE